MSKTDILNQRNDFKENADIAGEMSGHIFYKYQYYGYDVAITHH